jgi:hypothetical protein
LTSQFVQQEEEFGRIQDAILNLRQLLSSVMSQFAAFRKELMMMMMIVVSSHM